MFEDTRFVPVEEGSATQQRLEGEHLKEKNKGKTYRYEQGPPGAPWSREPSLKFLCAEMGINEDNLIAGIGQNKTDSEMALELGVSTKTIARLKKQFMTRGLASIQGQD